MNNVTLKTWMNVLPMNQWTSLYDPSDTVVITFRLQHYEIINGVPKFTIKIKREGTSGEEIIGGISETIIAKHFSVRFYVPIELHRVPGIGLSPKMVYRLPREYVLQEYRAEPYTPPHEAMAEKARKHTIIPNR